MSVLNEGKAFMPDRHLT